MKAVVNQAQSQKATLDIIKAQILEHLSGLPVKPTNSIKIYVMLSAIGLAFIFIPFIFHRLIVTTI